MKCETCVKSPSWGRSQWEQLSLAVGQQAEKVTWPQEAGASHLLQPVCLGVSRSPTPARPGSALFHILTHTFELYPVKVPIPASDTAVTQTRMIGPHSVAVSIQH